MWHQDEVLADRQIRQFRLGEAGAAPELLISQPLAFSRLLDQLPDQMVWSQIRVLKPCGVFGARSLRPQPLLLQGDDNA